MSYEATRAAWEFICSPEGDKLKPLDRLVLLNLADRMNGRTRRLNPSMTTIAKNCGCTDRSVRSALLRLMDAGVVVRRRPGNGSASNSYHLYLSTENSSDQTAEDISGRTEDSSEEGGKKRPSPRNEFPPNQEVTKKEPTDVHDAAAEGSVVAFRNYRRPRGPEKAEGIDLIRADDAMRAVMANLPWKRETS
jgi:predicted transcriptional regulator